MRYVISYVSTANPDLPKEEVKHLLKKTKEYNNNQDITGILLYSESNFFQLIEGEKEKIIDLFSNIEKDPRHNNIIKFIEKPVYRPAYDGYFCELVKESTKYDQAELERYLNYIEVLDPQAQKAVKRVIETIIME